MRHFKSSEQAQRFAKYTISSLLISDSNDIFSPPLNTEWNGRNNFRFGAKSSTCKSDRE
jgi:hypothetical protein